MSAPESVREFVQQIEKTLAAHRLYSVDSAPYRDANEKLLEKCRAAAADGGFTLRAGPLDLFLDKTSLINRPKREESFFYPLYRDGLRELTFTDEVSSDELEALLSVLETNERNLGAADDMVNLLWRAELTTIRHKAADSVDESETDGGEGGAQLRQQVADLVQRMRTHVLPESELRYANAPDIQSVPVTRVNLEVSRDEVATLRAELSEARDDSLVERFIEILFVLVRSPLDTLDASAVAPVFLQLNEGYWSAHDFRKLLALLLHMRAAAADAPRLENRAAMADAIGRFLSDDRVRALVAELERGMISSQLTAHLFDLVPEAHLWPLLLDMVTRLPEGDLRATVVGALRRRIANDPALMAGALASTDATQVRGALTLVDERIERLFANELVALTTHADESIRLKGLAAATRVGGEQAVEVLWHAMETDPAKSVRLYAFRAIASTPNLPGIAQRLQTLVTSAQFAERPVWEREKYVRLLGMVAGDSVQELFESWIPQKKWMWQEKDVERLELALRGLAACGEGGYAHVELLAETTGKTAEVARRVLDSISRSEIGRNTYMGGPK